MAMIEQRLMSHRDAVARLFPDQHCSANQEEVMEVLEEAGTRDRGSASGVSAYKEALREGDRAPNWTDIYDPSSDQTVQPNIDELPKDGLASDAVAENRMQHDSQESISAASQGFRLHISDFIQNLSE
jgi:hypothetical protein